MKKFIKFLIIVAIIAIIVWRVFDVMEISEQPKSYDYTLTVGETLEIPYLMGVYEDEDVLIIHGDEVILYGQNKTGHIIKAVSEGEVIIVQSFDPEYIQRNITIKVNK